MGKSFDVVVIGGGIAGASAAYWLSSAASVAVLEMESQPGYHATGRSAALFSEQYGNRVVRILASAGRRLFDNPPDVFGDVPLTTKRGALFIARSDQTSLLPCRGGSGDEAGLVVDGASAIEICPVLSPEYVKGALYEPGARDVDVHALHLGYLRGLRLNGGETFTSSEVIGLRQVGSGWTVTTRREEFRTEVVVNAAGAWCDEIARLAGIPGCGLIPKRRTAFTFDAGPGHDVGRLPATIDIGEDFYFKPEAGHLLGSPADETPSPPCDSQPEEIDIATGIARIERATILRVPRILHRWAGLRTFAHDKTPVVGFDPFCCGFCWLAGQGGYGIQTSPALGRVAAQLILEGALPADLVELGLQADDLSPGRLDRPDAS